MKGVLMTSAGNALIVNGKTITASTEFVPTTPDGTVDVALILTLQKLVAESS